MPASCTELPACTMFLPSEPSLIKAFLKLYFSHVQSELHSYIPINIFTNQSEKLRYDQSGQYLLNQSNCKDLEFSFSWGQANQGLGQGLWSVKVSSPLAHGEHIPLSTEDWGLHFSAWSWNTEGETLKTSSAAGARQRRAELSGWREASPHGLLAPGLSHSLAVFLHGWAVMLLSYSICNSVLLSQPCCITVELLALNKVSFFMAPQTGESWWCWIVTNDLSWQLQKKIYVIG